MDNDTLRPVLIPRLRAALLGQDMPKLNMHNQKTLARATAEDIERFMHEVVIDPVTIPLEGFLSPSVSVESEPDAAEDEQANSAESNDREQLAALADAFAAGADPA